MEFTIQYDAEKDLFVVEGRGEIRLADFQAMREQVSRHPAYRDGMAALLDLREGILALSGSEISVLAHHRKRRPVAGRLAIVAGKNFGMARMFQGWVGDDPEVGAFDEMREAEEWLLGTGKQK